MAMTVPFWVKLEATLTANGTGTLSYNIDPSEEWEFLDWLWTSTGTFEITGIRASNGINFSNVLSTNTIPSTLLPKGADDNHALRGFPVPMRIKENNILYIDIVDTSGSGNTVEVVLPAKKTTL
jgi:hypothetical protein